MEDYEAMLGRAIDYMEKKFEGGEEEVTVPETIGVMVGNDHAVSKEFLDTVMDPISDKDPMDWFEGAKEAIGRAKPEDKLCMFASFLVSWGYMLNDYIHREKMIDLVIGAFHNEESISSPGKE